MTEHDPNANSDPSIASAPDAVVKPRGGVPATLTAARDAAAFVAQIFADNTSDEGTSAPEVPSELSAPAANELPATLRDPVAVVSDLLSGQRVLILGLGTSGLAMARWCLRAGVIHLTVADTRSAPPQLEVLQRECPHVRFVHGPLDAGLVSDQDLQAIYCSPGLSPAAIAPVVNAARAKGVPVGGELDLFSAALGALKRESGYAPVVLAITGTNGKTRVTSLTGQLAAHAGKSVAVAGNIGPTLLDTLGQQLNKGDLPEVWVLELSSFQLHGVSGFEPTAATVLNITQDHLDWHGDLQAYAGAKAHIFGQQGLMVLNRDDAAVMAMLPPPARAKLQRPQWRTHISFGCDMPKRPGDFGLEEVNGMVWLVRALEADETRKKRRRPASANSTVLGLDATSDPDSWDADELHIQRLMPADALRIRGRHNASNALAALALCAAAGCNLAPILFGLREYRGEPHRVESVGVLNGVEFFDDSKGTNVGATVAALQGLGADRKLVLILGGDGKGQDFAPLAAPVGRYARAIVLIGRDAPAIAEALHSLGVPLHHAASMEEAVSVANQRAHAGDAVLMSPACASFDMFNNYEHRAQVFCTAVHALALSTGTQLEVLV